MLTAGDFLYVFPTSPFLGRVFLGLLDCFRCRLLYNVVFLLKLNRCIVLKIKRSVSHFVFLLVFHFWLCLGRPKVSPLSLDSIFPDDAQNFIILISVRRL